MSFERYIEDLEGNVRILGQRGPGVRTLLYRFLHITGDDIPGEGHYLTNFCTEGCSNERKTEQAVRFLRAAKHCGIEVEIRPHPEPKNPTKPWYHPPANGWSVWMATRSNDLHDFWTYLSEHP